MSILGVDESDSATERLNPELVSLAVSSDTDEAEALLDGIENGVPDYTLNQLAEQFVKKIVRTGDIDPEQAPGYLDPRGNLPKTTLPDIDAAPTHGALIDAVLQQEGLGDTDEDAPEPTDDDELDD